MTLDARVCRRARLARDPRFDGRFFIGVKTTGVFCRPVCPAVPPKETHVAYFPSAAAAAEAGFRACLRCRPECAPGTPAWTGTAAVVSRALRLIADGAFENGGVDALALRLGVGARHLRRLFVDHLGAAPIAVVQTHRLLQAKRLIDETDLPLTSIALLAGFGSIRRFNAAFLSSYGRSPRDLRLRRAVATRPPASASGTSHYSFQLRYRPPFDWDALLSFFEARAIPGVEHVERRVYRRTIVVGPNAGWLEVRPSSRDALEVSIHLPEPAAMLQVVSRVRQMFDLDADPMAIRAHLRRDSLLAPLVARRPGLRIPGGWDGFELGVRAILGQQVSVAAATTLSGRLVAQFGRPVPAPVAGLTYVFPTPQTVADADIRQVGVPAKRAEAIRAFAHAVTTGSLSFDGAARPEACREALLSLPGIGSWTAQYLSMRALADPDAFPAGDLGLLRAAGARAGRELEQRAEPWRPWRAYAALHLWQGAKDGRID